MDITKIKNIFFPIIIPFLGLVIFYSFAHNFAEFLFGRLSKILNNIICNTFNIKIRDGILNSSEWIYQLILIPWLSSLLFLLMSYYCFKKNKEVRFLLGLKIYSIICLLIFTYFSFEMIRFYISL